MGGAFDLALFLRVEPREVDFPLTLRPLACVRLRVVLRRVDDALRRVEVFFLVFRDAI